jgi:hypothetical protein
MRRRQCDVQGLLLGDCSQTAPPGEVLCTYHQKLADGVTVPPSGNDWFVNSENEPPAGDPVLAHLSYLKSNHPRFAYLIDAGGLTAENMAQAS